MFGEVFWFEVRYRLRQPAFYLFLAIFFLMMFGPVATDNMQVGGGIGNVARNAPYVIFQILGSMSAIGYILLTVFVTSAVNRDHELSTEELFFSTPLRKNPYLLGRFVGSLAPTIIAITIGALGMVVAAQMPWQDPERILPFSAWPYLSVIGIAVIPNLFLGGALFFSVATLSRRALWAWVTVVAFFTLWGISLGFRGDLENEYLAALLDPFGLASYQLITKYWTVAEKNTLLIPAGGNLLINRIIWMTIGFLILGVTLFRYRMSLKEAKSGTTLHIKTKHHDERVSTDISSVPAQTRRFDAKARLCQFAHLVKSETGGVLRGLPFIVLMLMGVMNLGGNLFAEVGGTGNYPVTRNMLRYINGGFDLMLFLVLVIYGAHLFWRERRARLFEVTDSLPIPDWMPLAAKLCALYAVAAAALLIAMATTVTFQIIKGYYSFEFGLYLKGLFLVSFSEWLLVGALAFLVHVLTNNRNLGFLVLILYFLAVEVLPEFGLEHRLYYFGKTPRPIYSDMNGYGHYVPSMFWFKLYWGFLATFLVLISNLLWVRGTDNRLKLRLQEAKRRLSTGRFAAAHTVALVMSFVGFLLVGSWIYYNTNILNDFRSESREKELQVLYETHYKQYEGLPQPRVKAVNVQVDIYPELRRVDLRGTQHVVNTSAQPISELHLLLNEELDINGIVLPAHDIVTDDREVGYRICRLHEPLMPGQTLDMEFDLTVEPRGFVNSNSNTKIVDNGTFFDNYHYLPRLGYDREHELSDPHDRRRHVLPPRQRALPVESFNARQHMAFSHDADWIDYEATVSTSPDQIAITPGYLQDEWIEDGRRYFHYKMDTPIVNFYTFVSGRYEVARDIWNNIAIEIYHHPTHAFNVGRMIEAIKKSLAYYTREFGSYQFRQVRIIEFPVYRRFAQSFPNTIPYSEGAHFINDLRDEENIDMVFFITAHETAHQWWGHQVIGGDVQGAQFLLESITQYSAFMVMEKDYGRDQMKKFLAYELDRYLSGRGNERVAEQPLMLVDQQPYIYYSKGGLALYALRDYIGEERLNGALRQFLNDKRFQDPPYTNSIEFLAYLYDATPGEFQYLIEDLFETITLYDNRADDAVMEPLENGKYRVTVAVESHKYRADGLGIETEIDHHDWVEIGVFGKSDGVSPYAPPMLYRQKHRIKSGKNRIEIVVDGEPVKAGIDPRNLLIDRVPGDNVVRVS